MPDAEHIATRETPGPFDGFEHAKPGEPIFTLQGGDPLGGPLVLAWATLARMRATGIPFDPAIIAKLARAAANHPALAKRDALLLRATEAEKIGWAMDEYLSGFVAAPETRASYNDAEEETEEARDALKRSRTLKLAEDRLHNALAEANDQAEILEALGDVDEEAIAEIREGVRLLKNAAEKVGPKRPSYMTPGASDA